METHTSESRKNNKKKWFLGLYIMKNRCETDNRYVCFYTIFMMFAVTREFSCPVNSDVRLELC